MAAPEALHEGGRHEGSGFLAWRRGFSEKYPPFGWGEAAVHKVKVFLGWVACINLAVPSTPIAWLQTLFSISASVWLAGVFIGSLPLALGLCHESRKA